MKRVLIAAMVGACLVAVHVAAAEVDFYVIGEKEGQDDDDVQRDSGGGRHVEPACSPAVFQDCPECPEMVVVPPGRFRMGSTSGRRDERPVHLVTIEYTFAVGVYEVTFAEWDACVSDGGCGGYSPKDDARGRGHRGSRPVFNVSWEDAQAYVLWLSRKTGGQYRLLSEAEWEYVARAGTTTAYWWGDDIGRNRANCAGCGRRWDSQFPEPVGSFSANPFGLHDVHGNVSEWVEDCYFGGYQRRTPGFDRQRAPSDGSAWTYYLGMAMGACGTRVLRGGSWMHNEPWHLRAAVREGQHGDSRWSFHGFRVAQASHGDMPVGECL